MSPIQQMLLGVGAVATKTYVDDIFSTYIYKGAAVSGSGSDITVNNGIDISTEGALVWIKNRSDTKNHVLADTVRGATKSLASNSNASETTSSTRIKSFSTTGFTVGQSDEVDEVNRTFSSWTFRKAPGFFDVVTYTGNGSNRTIAHSLGSIPGCIMIKATDASTDWYVWHRDLEYPKLNRLKLNESVAQAQNVTYWNQTLPTSTNFSLGTYGETNGSGTEYVAYLFAGGESTAATARSVDFELGYYGNDYLSQTLSNDLKLWHSQAFTVEYWIKADAFASTQNGGSPVVGATTPTSSPEYWSFGPKSGGEVTFYYWNGSVTNLNSGHNLEIGQWYHLAFVHDGSSNLKIFINGTLVKTGTIQGTPTGTADDLAIGQVASTAFDGKISNLRITHQALYSSSFKPTTEPLTTTSQSATASNVKLLCCNNSSATGSTVTPNTINANGSPTASTDSPFDDPAAFTFGDAGDQNVIKCGSYVGNGSSTGPEINLGWEPQFLMIKRTNSTGNWQIYDSMRGIVNGGNEARLNPNNNNAEAESEKIDLTPTGFKVKTSDGETNASGSPIVFVAIRRPDGYVGKPPELGTDVFTPGYGSSSNIPGYPSTSTYNGTGLFVTDFALTRRNNVTQDWKAQSRLTGDKYLVTNDSSAEATDSNIKFDYMTGFYSASGQDQNNSWMFKRHAGLDVVCWEGDGNTSKVIPHSLSKIPEMIWTKNRDDSDNWICYHKGLNGGTNPWTKFVKLNETSAEATDSANWNDTAPTATHFTVGNADNVNYDGHNVIAMLFASVNGISKVGYYTGTGSSGHTITLGFQARFIFLKRVSSSGSWANWDSLRTTASPFTKEMYFDATDSQGNATYFTVSSTGFTFNGNDYNGSSDKFIYYAHA